MSDYLPKDATIEQACKWLQAKTGQTWILPRLLECHLTPYFWLDYKPGYPIEGYQTRMMFQGDLSRLESDGTYALVNMFAAHDGALIKVEPGVQVPLAELRFKREHIERVAEIINRTKAAPAQSPAPVVAASNDTAPLTTGDIAFCFAGLRWDEQGWKKPLGDKPKWLSECVAIPGQRGVSEARWNPVLIGAALVHQGHVEARKVRVRFQTVDLLKPWFDAWKTYEADNFDTP
jgi:hypothetical protein